MLIAFSVGNYRSFREPVTLDLRAAPLKEKEEALNTDPIFAIGKLKLLRSAAIYGANASGKSNLVRAIMIMRKLVLDSAKRFDAGDALPLEPFRLDVAYREQPSYFEIVFWHETALYRYGFEATRTQVQREWLYRTRDRERLVFGREGQEFEIAGTLRREAPKHVQEQVRPNALFLSVLAQFNSPLASSLVTWFKDVLCGIHGLEDEDYLFYTMQRFEDDTRFQERVRELLRVADLGIVDLQVLSVPFDSSDIAPDLRRVLADIVQKERIPEDKRYLKRVVTYHPVVGVETPERFDLEDEAEGTQKFLALSGPLLDTLENGRVLVVDEFEARLHPRLTRELVKLFNSPQTNPNNAQLVFATHDAGLLGECLLRRDQIWFTEKNSAGATALYALSDIQGTRNDASYYKAYLSGRYGAVPLLASLRPYLEQELRHERTNQEDA